MLGRTDVLLAATVLFLLEMVADKIPYLDSAWDSVHTVIRPAVGATLGYLLGHESSSLDAAFGAAAGGFSALASHGVKAGLRAAVNTSPEPVSNVAVSSAEDLTVAGVVSLAALHPWWAASIAATLLVVGVTLVVFLLGRIRRFKRRYDAWGVRRGFAVPPAAQARSRPPRTRPPDAAREDRGPALDPEVGVDLERGRRAVHRVEVQPRRPLGQQPLRQLGRDLDAHRPHGRRVVGHRLQPRRRPRPAAACPTARPSGGPARRSSPASGRG